LVASYDLQLGNGAGPIFWKVRDRRRNRREGKTHKKGRKSQYVSQYIQIYHTI